MEMAPALTSPTTSPAYLRQADIDGYAKQTREIVAAWSSRDGQQGGDARCRRCSDRTGERVETQVPGEADVHMEHDPRRVDGGCGPGVLRRGCAAQRAQWLDPDSGGNFIVLSCR